jgi:hypothetical protein
MRRRGFLPPAPIVDECYPDGSWHELDVEVRCGQPQAMIALGLLIAAVIVWMVKS